MFSAKVPGVKCVVAGGNHWPIVIALRVLNLKLYTLEYKFKVSLLHGYFYDLSSGSTKNALANQWYSEHQSPFFLEFYRVR